MRSKTIRIAALGVPHDYRTSLVPLIIENLGYRIKWTSAIYADLVIYGSFYDAHAPRLRWLPRTWRRKVGQWVDVVDQQISRRTIAPVTLFHTAENLRHDHIKADFAISHDLGIESDRHLRLPYWMEVIDWSREGVVGNRNPRYGELLKLERLQAPLGDQFLRREQKAVLITSHLREPRANCLATLQAVMPVDGMGAYFDKKIKDHHKSDFLKKDILQRYAFNLCPENGIYPGYITEKIPEAFAAGCLPITCVDESICVDFNSKALINLRSTIDKKSQKLDVSLMSAIMSTDYKNEPLIIKSPELWNLKKFCKQILYACLN